MKPSTVLLLVGGLLAVLLPLSSARGQVTFPGPELLGRPEPYSITINVVANTAIQAYFEYGTQSGGPYTQTSPVPAAANVPLVVVLSGLSPDTQYFYRMVYSQTGAPPWTTRPEYSFHTARVPGDTYTFTVTSDSHINIVFGNPSLFQQTLGNIADESPDFHLDLGDTFAMDNVTTQAQANSSYLNIRTNYFSLISPSVPIFLVLGNHEQEEGWHLGDTGFAVEPPIMSANARNEYFLNPDPLLSSFYTGNTDTTYSAITSSSDHTIQDYYAWTWGDALFVVIDPYWYSTTKPYLGNEGGGESSTPGSGNRWDWTLGLTQYLWLQQTLDNSTAKYKFIFAHQVAGGLDDYGRGGANAVPYVEWGGNNDDGTTWAFNTNRTDVDDLWAVPVHQLLVDNHVTAFFHGHDHEYAHEQRDGVVYQEVPMAADATYGYGFQQYTADGVYTLNVLPNSGHLRVTVDPVNGVTVQYVRASLAVAGGTNGAIADSYNIPAPAHSPGIYVPVNNATLAGTSATFQWYGFPGASAYWLVVGSTAGGDNYYSSGNLGNALIATVNGLPTNGSTVYVTLYALVGGAWVPNAYTYTALSAAAGGVITTPTPGSTLSGSGVTFDWTAGAGASAYWLIVGSTAGGTNYYSSELSGLTATVNGLPTNGSTVYVTLYSLIGGAWAPNAYTYTAVSAAAGGIITTPTPGSTLSGSSVTFSWTAGAGASAYWLVVGSTAGGTNYYSSELSGLTATVNGLPTNGSTVYVTLYSLIGGAWAPNAYTYTAVTAAAGGVITTPTPGSTLSGGSVTFDWTAGAGASAYWLAVGSTAGGSNYYSSELSGLTATVNGLPTNGATIYVTLYSDVGGQWLSKAYTYVSGQ